MDVDNSDLYLLETFSSSIFSSANIELLKLET